METVTYLRSARERAGLSQAELAAEVGLSQTALSRLETEAGVGTGHETHLRLARLLRISPYKLTYGPVPVAERRSGERRRFDPDRRHADRRTARRRALRRVEAAFDQQQEGA